LGIHGQVHVRLVLLAKSVCLIETHFIQVLSNLINNSYKHHPDPKNLRLIFSAIRQGKVLHFCLSDNGPGIIDNDQPRAFEMFQTLGKKKESSTGLGLSLVKKLVERNGGRVWFESFSKLIPGASLHFTWIESEYDAGVNSDRRLQEAA
jgi:signal transduction histidine kinase